MSVAAPSAPAAASEPWFKAPLDWLRLNPASAALWAALAVIIVGFFGEAPLFAHRASTFDWAWLAWNPETKYDHAKLVPLIIAFLIWYAMPQLRRAKVRPTNFGWAPLIFGALLYLAAARTLQPRLALLALPFIFLGIALNVGGPQIARILLFPIACLLFLIPLPGIDQATVGLQLFVTQAAKNVCGVLGIHLIAVGTTLHAADKSFEFEIIGDCSGINSLMAITLMTAIFAHLAQDRIWKKLALFACSAPVAVVGNIARITAVMVVARFFGQQIAGGWFHEMSAYIVSFPFAFGALCLVNKVLNWIQPVRNAPPGGATAPAITSAPDRFQPLAWTELALVLALGCVFLVPSKTGPGKAGITLALPREFGMWTSRDIAISQAELTGLAPDTGFARRMYIDPFGDEVSVSIVLSGEDMANSIHRPERCLPAQGWTVVHSERIAVPIQGEKPLETTKLFNVAERKVDGGKTLTFRNLTYYWFVGYRDVTASHWTRAAIDIKDRILHGENQRWAYVTVAATVTDNLKRFGHNEEQTAKMIEDLIREVVPQLQRPTNNPE